MCKHWYVIPSARTSHVTGTCKKCGDTKVFDNIYYSEGYITNKSSLIDAYALEALAARSFIHSHMTDIKIDAKSWVKTPL